MTHDEAEALRSDPDHWRWGVFYYCPQDPRLIVRNNFVFGWTWNFSHPWVFPAIFAAVGFLLGLPYFLAINARLGLPVVSAVFVVCLLLIVIVANHIANGPR